MGAGVMGGLYAWLVERVDVELDRFTIEVNKPGLPPEGLTILHLSDLHCRADGRIQAAKMARLRRQIADESYDLVVLTGDLIHNPAGLAITLAFIDDLSPRLGAFSCPGNRDYWESGFSAIWGNQSRLVNMPAVTRRLWAFVRGVIRNERATLQVSENDLTQMHGMLAQHDVRPLVNRAAHVTARGCDFWVTGVDDETQGRPDVAAALADVPAGALLLLLAHNPDSWLAPGADRADLVLAGHTHGGQIRFPLVGALYRQGTHLPRRRSAGWFTRGASRMFVSRGVGESFPLRFGARPQVALIRLVSRGQGRG